MIKPCKKTKMRILGEGGFTRAYLRPDGKVQLHSSDPMKEFIAEVGFPNHPMFPKCKKIGTDKEGEVIYVMERLETTETARSKKKLNSRQMALFRALEVVNENATWNSTPKKLMEDLDKLPDRFTFERKLLKEAMQRIDDWGRVKYIALDVMDFNLAVKRGRLVLLDCFYPND